jgi:acyl-coenzyme A thioesterase PaaI-like protein
MSSAPLPDLPGGQGYGPLVEATRELMDAVAALDAPSDALIAATRTVRAVTSSLAAHTTDELHSPAGKRPDLPGRGNVLLPPILTDRQTPDEVQGRVTLTRAHLGGGGAAHGGVIPLMFDDVLGRAAGLDRPPSRTAYLHVDYANLTPVNRELRIEGFVYRIEGRKIYVKGRLLDGGTLLAEADALFVMARSEPPAPSAAPGADAGRERTAVPPARSALGGARCFPARSHSARQPSRRSSWLELAPA